MQRVQTIIVLWVVLLCCGGADTCGGTGESASSGSTPSNDPADYQVDTAVEYTPELSPVRWIVPADNLPEQVEIGNSNNNVDIIFFEGRLFFAWRTAPNHFASPQVRMYIMSSADDGKTWRFEHEIAIHRDVREPRFVSIGGELIFYYSQLGSTPSAFEPSGIWRIRYEGDGKWSAPERFSRDPEIIWRMKTRGDWVYMTSYRGSLYHASGDVLDLYFKRSRDGLVWEPVKPAKKGVVYTGGASETAFEFDQQGKLWAVTRNEQGDKSGFGSHFCSAPRDALGSWTCSKNSDPHRYDSPAMIRHGDDFYLIARRNLGVPYDEGDSSLSFSDQKNKYLLDYWQSPKRTALYRVDTDQRKVIHIKDLPSAGDTAFPAVRRLDAHRFLIANYTSPLENEDISWLQGQSGKTSIYFTTLTFVPKQ